MRLGPIGYPVMGPTTVDEKLLQADRFREARERLESALKDINTSYSSPQALGHTGPPNCERCSSRKRKITEAFYEYYLSDTPGRWDTNLLEYKQEMIKKFNQPNGPNLEEIQAHFQTTFRQYLKQTIFNPKEYHNSDVQSYKNMAADLIDQGKSINEVLETYHNSQLQACNPTTAAVIRGLSDSLEPRERAQIYISAYCSPLESDSAPVKNIKQKYVRMFEKLVPHDEVISAWRTEAAASQDKNLSELKSTLADLQLGQSAHLKNKAKKAEKERKVRDQTPQMVMCGKMGCPVDVNLNGPEEITVCEICEWMEKNGRGFAGTVYCSDEHCEDDFEEHERREHQCNMGDRCIYFPEPGPDEEDGARMCGLCPDCKANNTFNYFCSKDCYLKNAETHHEEAHGARRWEREGAAFIPFPQVLSQPADDMDVS